jgi:hypothetical protein
MSRKMTPVPFTDPRWTHLRVPVPEQTISKDGSELTMLTETGTDWWRTPTVDSFSGAVYGFGLPLEKEGFEVSVELDIRYETQVTPPFRTMICAE